MEHQRNRQAFPVRLCVLFCYWNEEADCVSELTVPNENRFVRRGRRQGDSTIFSTISAKILAAPSQNCSHTLFYCVREQSILGSHSVHGYMVLSLLAHGSCLCSTHVLIPDKCLSSSSKQWTFFAPVGRRVALWFGATHVIAPKEVILIFGFRQEEVRNAMVVQCLVR